MPTGLVKNEVGFAAYEAGVSALSILAPYEMARHGHRRLARLGQGIDVVSIGYTVVHNYRTTKSRCDGVEADPQNGTLRPDAHSVK
jgi:hypothetical protein